MDALSASASPADEQIEEVIALTAEAGGIEGARQKGEEYARQADDALDGLPDTPARTALADAILYVMDRRS